MKKSHLLPEFLDFNQKFDISNFEDEIPSQSNKPVSLDESSDINKVEDLWTSDDSPPSTEHILFQRLSTDAMESNRNSENEEDQCCQSHCSGSLGDMGHADDTVTKLSVPAMPNNHLYNPITSFKFPNMMLAEAYPNVAAYWDIENCPMPKAKSVRAFVKKVRDHFYEGFTEEEFVVVCDVLKEKKEIVEELNFAQVEIEHVTAQSKNAADEKLRQKIRNFADIARPSSRVILITSDINFIGDLRFLRYKKKLNVILIHNKQVNSALLDFANENIEFEEFVQDLPLRNAKVSNDNKKPFCSLLVQNLPCSVPPNHLKNILNRTFDNCGGKVAELRKQPPQNVNAVMKFRSADDAARARNRFQDFTILDRKIEVDYLTDSETFEEDSHRPKAVKVEEKTMADTPTTSNRSSTSPIKKKTCWLMVRGDSGVTESSLKQTMNKLQVPHRSFTFHDGVDGKWISTMQIEGYGQAKRIRKLLIENLDFQITVEVYRKMPKELPSETSREVLDKEKFREEFLGICNKHFDKHYKKKRELMNQIALVTLQEQKEIQTFISILDSQLSEFQKTMVEIFSQLEKAWINPISLKSLLIKECERFSRNLPIDVNRNAIVESFKRNQILLIVGPPGSGKSSQVIQYITEENLEKLKLYVVVEPYKICVALQAHAVSNQSGIPVKTITHSYKELQDFKKKLSFKVLFVTDEILLMEYKRDPQLKFCDCIIMDELQERSDFTEILLPLLKILLRSRPNLKLILISSDEKSNTIYEYFSPCEIIQVPINKYPVEIIWKPVTANQSMVEHIIEVVSNILQETSEGNILAFFPHCFDILMAQSELEQHFQSRTDLDFIPIYSEILYEDISQATSIRRKVFLSTSVCQSAVNLPNTSYVVDCGINRSFSGTTISEEYISQIEAKWRLMRAGAKLGGKCYRCYSENDLKNAPEIICWKPNMERLLLQVLAVDGPSIESFCFVQPVSAEALKIAWKNLTEIKAVSVDRLTSEGHQIVALPLKPRLAILVIEALKNDLPLSYVLFLVSLMTIYEICPEFGKSQNYSVNKFPNLLEVLKSFADWCNVNDTDLMKWFRENKIDKTSAERICDHVMEIFAVIKNDFNYTINRKCSQRDWFFSLQKLLVKCWNDSVSSIYQSSKKTYLNLKTRRIMNLLPLNNFTCDPVYVVYEKVVEDNQHELYMINPLPIDILLVEKSISEESLHQSLYIRFVGRYLMRKVILGNHNNNLTALISELDSKIPDSKVSIDVIHNAGQIIIHSSQKYHMLIREKIDSILLQAKQSMLLWVYEFQIDGSGYSRVQIGSEGNIKKCLTTDDYSTVLVELPKSVKCDSIIEELKEFGRIVRYYRKKGKHNILIIQFSESETAKKAVKEFKKYKIEPVFPPKLQSLSSVNDCTITVSWTRRRNLKCAIVNFALEAEKLIEAQERFNQLILRNKILENVNVVVEASQSRILLRNLNPLVTKQELIKYVNSVCNKIGIPIMHLDLPQTKAFCSSTEEVNFLTEKLEKLIREIDPNLERVEVCKPKDKDEAWTASITFQNSSNISEALQYLTQGLHLDGIPLKYEQKPFTAVIHCDIDIQKAILNPLTKALNQFNQTFGSQNGEDLKISTNKDRKCESASFIINAALVDDFVKFSHLVTTFIQGKQMPISGVGHFFLANHNEGKQKLAAIAKEEGVIIKLEEISGKLYFWGEAININRTLNKLERLLCGLESECNAVHTYPYGDSAGFFSFLLSEFGNHLLPLCDQTGCIGIEFDLLERCFKIYGNKTSRKTLLSKLTLMKEKFVSQVQEDCLQSVDVCPVCLAKDVNDVKHYRLEYCGHAYCFPCIAAVLANCRIPLKCIEQSCQQPLVSLDFNYFDKEFNALLNQVIRRELIRISTSADSWVVICPTPLCQGILFYLSQESPVICPKCKNAICLRCRKLHHYGQKCVDFANSDLLEEFRNKFMI